MALLSPTCSNSCRTPVLGLGLGVDFTFATDNNNNNNSNNKNNNPHLNFLKGTVLGIREARFGKRVKGQGSRVKCQGSRDKGSDILLLSEV